MKEGDFVKIEYVGRIKESGTIFDLTNEEIAKKENFNLILEKDSILYCEDAVDLTDKVIEALNKAEGK